MQWYDFVVLALLIAATVWGARRGFAKQLASVLSIVLGYIVAVNFRQQAARLIDAPHPWNSFAAMLGLFVLTSLMVWIAFRFVNDAIDKIGLTGFDKQLGGAFGMAKGFLLAVVMTMFSVVMLGDSLRGAVLGSTSGKQICQFILYSQRFVPAEWGDVMRPYLETVQEHTAQGVHTQPTLAPSVVQPLASDPNLDADPFGAESPSDRPAFSDPLTVGPAFDELHHDQPVVTPTDTQPSHSQARLGTPIFER